MTPRRFKLQKLVLYIYKTPAYVSWKWKFRLVLPRENGAEWAAVITSSDTLREGLRRVRFKAYQYFSPEFRKVNSLMEEFHGDREG